MRTTAVTYTELDR